MVSYSALKLFVYFSQALYTKFYTVCTVYTFSIQMLCPLLLLALYRHTEAHIPCFRIIPSQSTSTRSTHILKWPSLWVEGCIYRQLFLSGLDANPNYKTAGELYTEL